MDGADKRILIVDDEPQLLKMMRAYLRRLGYSVETAGTKRDALQMFNAEPDGVGVVVLDATMDGLSMQELGSHILAANGSLRIIAASGYPVDIGPLEAAASGRVMFLQKPFTPEMLASAVRR